MAFSPIFAAMQQLVHSWWCVDRIRVSPLEGKLWRVQPGNTLQIDGELVEVVSRTTCEQENAATLELICRTPAGLGRLRVSSSPANAAPLLLWQGKSGIDPVPVADVQVWN